MNADGSEQTNLTNHGANDYSPNWQPIGGPGPAACKFAAAERTLTVRILRNALVSLDRKGDVIVVTDNGRPIACVGAVPTVNNTDAITVSDEGGSGAPTLFIGLTPPLAPGATDEGDGSSEIELSVDFSRAGSVFFDGTPGSEAFTLGERSGERAVNLNPAEATPDADVELGAKVQLVVFTRGGSDSIGTPGSGGGFSGPYPGRVHIFAGGGADRVQGTVLGDNISLGGGRDRVNAKEGSDLVNALDRRRDRGDCGPGRDFGVEDRRDRLRHCEDMTPPKTRPLARLGAPADLRARLLRIERAKALLDRFER